MSIMCSYQDCLCVKYPCSSIAFFRLPADSRRNTWIKNSGNKSLQNIGVKAHRFFCENHFRECDIRTQFNRKILRKHAVPIEHTDLKDSMFMKKKIELCGELTPFGDHYNEFTSNSTLQVEKIDALISQEFDNAEMQDQATNKNGLIEGDFDNACTVIDFYMEQPCEEEELCVENYSGETNQRNNLDEIYYEDTSSHRPESNVDLQLFAEDIEDVTDNQKPIEATLQADTNSSNHDQITSISTDYDEDRHFALSLVGYFQRLPKDRRAVAKLRILQYLTDLDIGLPASL